MTVGKTGELLVRGKLEVTVEGDATSRRATLVGRIDESAHLDALADTLAARELVIDSAGVTFINSVGVRDWIRLMRGLVDRGAGVVLEACSEPVVSQLNMIPAARAGVQIASVHVPYLCDACGLDAAMLVPVAAYADELRKMKPPVLRCPECGGVMTLADLPERYFTFLVDRP
jgi:anti-anti-sigma regulatory factor